MTFFSYFFFAYFLAFDFFFFVYHGGYVRVWRLIDGD